MLTNRNISIWKCYNAKVVLMLKKPRLVLYVQETVGFECSCAVFVTIKVNIFYYRLVR